MKSKIRKYILVCLIAFTSIVSMGSIEANEVDINIIGKVYTFEDEDYIIKGNKEYTSTNEDVETYGKFSVKGAIADSNETNGVPTFEVSNGNVDFSYTYGDSLLKAKDSKWHLYDIDESEIDSIDLDDDIEKGAIVLQTSKDRKNWINEVVETNVFEDKPIETESFYTTNDMQLSNGCYYRLYVVYEVERNKGKEDFLFFFSKDKNEYKNYVEVYEFYMINQDVQQERNDNQKFSLGKKAKVSGTGYVDEEVIDKDDPHYGWDLGNFFVSGYTSNTKDNDGDNVFLKNVDDKVTLWFNLSQDINKLNKNDGLSIMEDSDAFDQQFETPRTEFGKGTLIIRYTDHENVKHEPTIYKNYLVGSATLNTDTVVQVFEEGDYEVTLDYAIESDGNILGFIPKSDKTYYKIQFKFSIRNGNCMAFPMNLKTKEELSNTTIAQDGFYLDLAKSRYLDINIKKEVLNDGVNGLVEDVRFNRPAKDGDAYSEEGIYTITIKNKYTQQVTEKIIYVGANDVLKAHAVTGLSIKDIQEQIDNGGIVNLDGTITGVQSNYVEEDKEEKSSNNYIFIIIALIAVGVGGVFVFKRKRNTDEGENL